MLFIVIRWTTGDQICLDKPGHEPPNRKRKPNGVWPNPWTITVPTKVRINRRAPVHLNYPDFFDPMARR
jgi:hypothetical protein